MTSGDRHQGLTLRLCGGVCPQHPLFAAAESHGCLARNFGMIWMGKASHRKPVKNWIPCNLTPKEIPLSQVDRGDVTSTTPLMLALWAQSAGFYSGDSVSFLTLNKEGHLQFLWRLFEM